MRLLDKVRNRTARVRQHRWRMRPYRSTERHVVIGGSPRSGTTLLRRILDRHPALCCSPELSLYLPNRFQLEPLSVLTGVPADELGLMFRSSTSQGELIDRFAARYRELRGKPRWVEKTPRNVRHFGWITERFPDAQLIHVIRDGRDAVCSAARHPDRRWVRGAWVWELHQRPIEHHARNWVLDTGAGLQFRGHPRYHELRYEDLVTRPEETLRSLCEFLGEAFDERLLLHEGASDGPAQPVGSEAQPVGSDRQPGGVQGEAQVPPPRDRGPLFTSSIGRWRTDLSERDQQAVMRIIGGRLEELGYLP
jgi:hypothetical protein